jgi:threonine dehydrogenase-like Zn-dependent dehydrogenase
MAGTCKAVVFSGKGSWEIREFRIPEPPPGGAVLKVEAVGMCHSDADMFNGITHTRNAIFPAIPGHETVGRIHALSPEAAQSWGVKEGDRVALGMAVPLNGDYYVYGHDFSAEEGDGLYGGYGEYMALLPGTQVYKLREDRPADELTFFNPLVGAVGWTAPVQPGDTFVVEGPGHMGLACIIAAKIAGAGMIIATGTASDHIRLAAALKIGADHVINVDAEDPLERVTALTGGKMADVVLDASSTSTAPIHLALKMVRREGTIVLGGLKDHKSVDGIVTDDIVLRRLTIQGARGGHISRSVELINSGVVPTQEVLGASFPMDQVGDALDALHRKGPGGDAVRVSLRLS